ncbi:hypothetical protein LOY35_11435 [Pseudomonas sp. B21-028]|uniref:hypothetical protein n=1 Tax=Pseudomonas TaxID=286 RepID=UPI00216012A3|nr:MULTISPECIES: hypothetical protein [Pseudomonas]UVL86151.1 hypothetical protein LOY35_11435 [Pseudomonas sp. B21-028]UVM70421.1 hypothetical protein LOY40_17650 [Pseudomonas canavaninivorans]
MSFIRTFFCRYSRRPILLPQAFAQTSGGANQTHASTREFADLAGELNAIVKHFIV